MPPSPAEARDVWFSGTLQTGRAPICLTGGPRNYTKIIFITLHLSTHFHREVVADLDAVTDDTICLGATVEGVRERGVEALYLGTDEATTVGAGCGELPHRFLSGLGLPLLVLTEKTPVDGESRQLLTLPADIRHPVHGQNLTVLVSDCPRICSATAGGSNKAVVDSEVRELLLTVLSRHCLGRGLHQQRQRL